MQKVEGIQNVRVGLKDGLTVLDLRPDNKVTLAQLRTVIKNNGFVSKDAQVTARGSVSVRVVAGRHLACGRPILTGGGYTKYRISGPARSS